MARITRRKAAAPDASTYAPDADDDQDSVEEAPRARGRSRREPDEDEEDEPRTKRKSPAGRPLSTAGKGWGSYNKQKSEGGDYAEQLKVTDEAVLIKFLEDEPFVVYRQHWLERQGKRSFTCHGEGCVLCDDLGDKPRLQACFNVVDLTDPDNPEVKVWIVGTRVAGALKNFAADKKTAPLDRENLYWAVSKSGTGSKTQYTITPVKERDLAEDWDFEPLTSEEIEDFRKDAYDESIVDVQTRKQLEEIVEELAD
jgi:hypothetical protein